MRIPKSYAVIIIFMRVFVAFNPFSPAGKSSTFFDPAMMLATTSPSFVAPHSLFELSNSSGSTSNMQTPMNSKGGRYRSKYRLTSKTPQAGDQAQRLPLEGRNAEINQVFAFLCPAFVAKFGPLTEFAPSAGKFSFNHGALASPILATNTFSPNGRALRFDTTCRTKACIIQGPGGVGKSSFLKIFCEKVRNIHRGDPTINMVMFHSQTKGNNAQPFNVWKTIVRQILLQFAQLADSSGGVAVGGGGGASKSQAQLRMDSSDVSQKDSAGAAAKADLLRGLDLALASLPSEQQELKPLVSSIHFVYGLKDNEVTGKLSGKHSR